MGTFKILIMGLPGAGKSTLANYLKENKYLNAKYLDADEIRKEYDDWDFSEEGRIRQAKRMSDLAEGLTVANFVCPTRETRDAFRADYTIFMDTVNYSRFSDTDSLFERPESPDFVVPRKLSNVVQTFCTCYDITEDIGRIMLRGDR